MKAIPDDFATALQAARLADHFTNFTSAHQNEYLKWIAEAKRPATRARRIAKAVKMISDKRAKAMVARKKK